TEGFRKIGNGSWWQNIWHEKEAKNLHEMSLSSEQHFKDKPEISGTARKIAETLKVDDERITSLRLGGIIGHHEVIFGFPHQTVRLTHESIRREAFGTGAAFALTQLADCENGFYTFDDLLLHLLLAELQREQ
ncbi:MAG: dihydrodipicolinate, partial [Gallionellaceae bacterium]